LLQEDRNTHNDPTIARTSEDRHNSHVSNEPNNNWETVTDISINMASEAVKVDGAVVINQSYQSNSSINATVKGENIKVITGVASTTVILDGLQHDLSELIHILHVTERASVKEIIQADIQLLLSKIESIEDLNMKQLETNISWSRVATLKHNKN